jgi:hypothetical protein
VIASNDCQQQVQAIPSKLRKPDLAIVNRCHLIKTLAIGTAPIIILARFLPPPLCCRPQLRFSDIATKYCIESKYPYDINFVIAGRHDDNSGEAKWTGPDGWVGHIAAVTGRKFKWDTAKQEIIGDAEASKMMFSQMREPWHS